MTTLLLVRHGRSTSNAQGTLAGRNPGIELDDTGRSQAMSVGERIRGVQLDAVVHSPMLRCQQTAELATQSSGLHTSIEVEDGITECDYGEWTGRPLSELARESLWTTIQQTPSTVRFPGGEAMADMQRRCCEAVVEWNRRLGPDATWMLVSHADPIKAIISDALAQPFDAFQRLMIDPASISVLHFPSGDDGPGTPVLVSMNSTSGQVRSMTSVGQPRPQPGGGSGSQESSS